MGKTEYMLERNLGNWIWYAEQELGIPENRASVIWHNEHNKGKYLVCEARDNAATRLFVRNVTNPVVDAAQKKGWWNIFTVTKNPTSKGLWLAQVVEYRLDRNGYLNLEVETVLPIDDIKFHMLFESTDGTWNSIAWWLMMVCSNAFLSEYHFEQFSFHEPNFVALVNRFPELDGLMPTEMGKVMLHKYLRNEASLEEIEQCLNTLTDWEQLCKDIQVAVANHTVEPKYGEKYPMFAKKVVGNVLRDGFVNRNDVENYLQRQINFYDELISLQKIEPVDGYLEKVEVALSYRKTQKRCRKTG